MNITTDTERLRRFRALLDAPCPELDERARRLATPPAFPVWLDQGKA